MQCDRSDNESAYVLPLCSNCVWEQETYKETTDFL